MGQHLCIMYIKGRKYGDYQKIEEANLNGLHIRGRRQNKGSKAG